MQLPEVIHGRNIHVNLKYFSTQFIPCLGTHHNAYKIAPATYIYELFMQGEPTTVFSTIEVGIPHTAQKI